MFFSMGNNWFMKYPIPASSTEGGNFGMDVLKKKSETKNAFCLKIEVQIKVKNERMGKTENVK